MQKLSYNILRILLFIFLGIGNAFSQDHYYFYHDSKIYLSVVPKHYAIQFLESFPEAEKLSYLDSLNLEIFSFNGRPEGYCVAKIQSPALLSGLSRSSLIRHFTPLLEFGDGMKCFIPNRFIVKFKQHITKAEIDALNQKYGASIVQKYPYRDNVYILSADSAGSLAALEMANQYHQFPEIEFAEPDIMMSIRPLGVIPNDPLFSYQWYLDQTRMSDAWEISRGSESVVAAVLDEGVDLLHEDLINRFSEMAAEILSASM